MLFHKKKRLRFTGESPPPNLWPQYPNWRLALDEEGQSGQDGTTLMPHEEQSFVGEHTSFTAGSVHLRDGRKFPALLEVGSDQKMDGCRVYQSAIPWRVYFNYPEKRWMPFSEDWLPEAERSPSVSMNDASIFPLEIRMNLPWKAGEFPAVYEISPDGRLKRKA